MDPGFKHIVTLYSVHFIYHTVPGMESDIMGSVSEPEPQEP
jgi:hypothetical protein